MTHDEAIEQLFLEYMPVEKRRYTDLFLSSLTDSKWNSGLYVYATMKTFPKHSFMERTDGTVDPKLYAKWTDEEKLAGYESAPCYICASRRIKSPPFEWEGMSQEVRDDRYYFVIGSTASANNIYDMLYILQRINQQKCTHDVTEQDFAMFKEIVSFLQYAEPDTKIKDIIKRLKDASFFKPLTVRMKEDGIRAGEKISVAESCKFKMQSILETMGVCGILCTEKHKGAFYEYTNPAATPHTSRSSYWQYPADFWKGCDGINREAFDYWFGEYEELKDI